MTSVRGTLPTLTEVIELAAGSEPMTPEPAALAPESRPMEAYALPLPRAALADPHAALVAAVLDTLEPRLDTLLEARLNAAIAPQLRRLVQDAIRQVRGEMAASLQALVAQAIDDALAKRKKP